ncbi:MAG TPA: NAD(+)/NADH kinase [Mariprofundaceae bacterium]|nr:NAD(+)/NADH kinase [Mariprofundaceae bacterium]
MKRIGISCKLNDRRASELAMQLRDWLQAKKCRVLMDEVLGAGIGDTMPLAEMPGQVELMIVLGGDGTLLHVARRFAGAEAPILGINLGRLGFLTDTPVGSMFDVVDDVLRGHFKIKRHFTLTTESWRGDNLLSSGHAMNDVVLQRNEQPRMIAFELYVREHLVFRMRGDGLILATPAGSTAYALSAGGAIVHPDVDAISVVPICPHTLSNRPIILPATDSIELRVVEAIGGAALNLDGQEHLELVVGDRVIVEKGPAVSLVYLPERHYFEVLRTKLHWAGQITDQN